MIVWKILKSIVLSPEAPRQAKSALFRLLNKPSEKRGIFRINYRHNLWSDFCPPSSPSLTVCPQRLSLQSYPAKCFPKDTKWAQIPRSLQVKVPMPGMMTLSATLLENTTSFPKLRPRYHPPCTGPAPSLLLFPQVHRSIHYTARPSHAGRSVCLSSW